MDAPSAREKAAGGRRDEGREGWQGGARKGGEEGGGEPSKRTHTHGDAQVCEMSVGFLCGNIGLFLCLFFRRNAAFLQT